MRSLTWKNDTTGIIYWLRLDMSLGQVEVWKGLMKTTKTASCCFWMLSASKNSIS